MSSSEVPTHSRIGASSFYRWSECPGSVALSEGIPQKSSIYAEEGTRAHEVAATILLTGNVPPGVDPEMLAAVNIYIDEVRKLWGEIHAR